MFDTMERSRSVCAVSYYARKFGEEGANRRRHSGQFGDQSGLGSAVGWSEW
jgi:hypothetical protein